MPNASSPIIIVVSNPAGDSDLVGFGRQLAAAFEEDLILLHVVELPEGKSLSEATAQVTATRRQLEPLIHKLAKEGVLVRGLVRVARQAADEISRVALEERARFVLCRWTNPPDPMCEFDPLSARLLDTPPCDIIILHNPPSEPKSILVAVRGGPYARLATDIGSHLAASQKTELAILHIYNQEGVEASLLPEARQHDLLILGAHGPQDSPVRLNFSHLKEAGCGIMVVRTQKDISSWYFQQPRWNHSAVEKWFAENTFDAAEFADIGRLVDIKRGLGVTISLCLPALNEARTIGQILTVMKGSLCEEANLLDEIVVIDSGSDDGTPEVARSLGIPVYNHTAILPAYGTFKGKGEALWKSLYVLKGDLIVWLDSDIRDPGPHMVYGLVGPLLHHPHLTYVKGYYSRPIKVGEQIYESGGGRVTELMARPLLNLFSPELSGFIQPLAGQYAGWRHILERMPFFTGYGVETGLLIDILAAYGLEAMGQVNLGRLAHRNSPLTHLSTMSFSILQVVISRLEAWQRLEPLEAVNKSMKLIRWEADHLSLDVREIEEAERPPMITIPEYRLRHPAAEPRPV